MYITLVWADDKHTTEGFNNRITAEEYVYYLRKDFGRYADVLTTRPDPDGIAGLLGIRPIFDIFTGRLVGVWIENGTNVAKIDSRDSILTLI